VLFSSAGSGGVSVADDIMQTPHGGRGTETQES